MTRTAALKTKTRTWLKRIRSRRGITLLELLIAIALIGIVAGFTIPGLQGIQERNTLNNAKDDVLSAITVARNRALANDQSGASGSSDCYWDQNPMHSYKTYYANYRFAITSTMFYVQQEWKQKDRLSNWCYFPNTNVDGTTIIVWYTPIQKKLPSSVHFQIPAGKNPTIWYSTTGGAVRTAYQNNGAEEVLPPDFQLELVDSKLPSDNIYYFCFNSAGVPRAQKTPCS